MNYYSKYVISLPNLSYAEKVYLLIAYDICDEDYGYYQRDVKKYFPTSSLIRIESGLLKKGHIASFIYEKKKKYIKLNYKKC